MKFEHEIINSKNLLPFKAFTFYAKDKIRIIPQHWHQSTELLYCIFGNLNVWINGQLYVMKKNDIILINPNVVHSTQSPTYNHILCIQLPLPFLQEITEDHFNTDFLFKLNTVKNQKISPKKIQKLLNNLVHIIEINKNSLSLVNKIKEQAIVLSIISTLIEKYSINIANNHLANNVESINLMSKITQYINNNFYKELSLHQVANEFNYSESYFSRIFKLNFNMNFHEFLISLRLNNAINQLITTNHKISRVAYDSGFSTYRNFYNAFIHTYKVTPQEYRRKFFNDFKIQIK